MRSPPVVRRRLAFALVTAYLVGCNLDIGGGGGGDLDRISPRPKETRTPIADANTPSRRLADKATLVARGVVVVAVDNYDETGDGKSIGDMFVQDAAPTLWSGVTLYKSMKSPADLQLTSGNGVDVIGSYEPFAGPAGREFPVPKPQVVRGAVSLVFEGQPPTPIDITLEDLTDQKQGMAYVGRLVRMRNVIVGKYESKRREAPIGQESRLAMLAAQLYPVDEPHEATEGKTLKSVTGLLNYFYNFKLCPRSPADVEP